MLALATTDALAFIDPSTLKRTSTTTAPSPSILALTSSPTACVWSTDTTSLFLSSDSNAIHKYNYTTGSATPTELYTSDDGPVSHLLAKDKGGSTLIFSAAHKIHILECGSSTPKIAQTIDVHNSPITALALSNDNSLLASASSGAAYVHNLTLGGTSHTVLRGLPSSKNASITACAFHPHTRTRLLLGISRQLVVYDTTRPSAPLKVVPMGDGVQGEINAIACSPFSKTLVAVCMTGGHVGLVDLDKEKGLFRTLNLKVPLTSALFSPEGAALYFATEHGRLLVIDLRALDKPPRSVVVSEHGARVVCMAVQKKTKTTSSDSAPESGTTTTTAKSKSVTATSAEPNPPAPAPTRRTTTTTRPPRALPSTTTAKPASSPTTTQTRTRVRSATLTTKSPPAPTAARAKTATAGTPVRGGKAKVFSPARDPLGNSGSMADGRVKVKGEPVSAKLKPSGMGEKVAVSRGSADSLSAGTASSRSTRSSGRGSASAATSRVAAAPAAAQADLDCQSESESGRTPSPDLPAPLSMGAMTPVAKKRGMGVLGLGTPEVERWIEAGKGDGKDGKGKKVGFVESDGEEDGGSESEGEKEREREEGMAVQLSPLRPSPASAWSAIPSPLRPSSSSTTPNQNQNPQDLLRTIIRDVMFDFQLETRAELTGLHLDLVRLGRGWRRELRGAVEEAVGALREENRLLREENERLRARGVW